MARIGIELQKEFKESSILRTLRGSAYSAFVVLGPMLVVIAGYVVLNVVIDQRLIPYDDRDLLTSVGLYVFIFSLILSVPLSAVISRYISDSIFEERTEDVIPCFYTGLGINLAVASAACIPFGLVTVLAGGADPLVIFVGAWMFFSLFFTFYTMTYISALKEYTPIANAFLVGIAAGVALAYILLVVFRAGYVLSILTGYAVGFTYVAARLFSLVKRFFEQNSRKYKLIFSYIKEHFVLLLVNFFYITGFFVHNIVFWWNSEYYVVVAGTLRSAPVYDVATFLAMLTNCSIMVLFTVRTESNFYDKYKAYCQELIGGTGDTIYKAKQNMFQTLSKEVFFIVQVQAIISLIFFLLIILLGPRFSFGGLVLYIYPALAAGYLILFTMYCLIIFLYYFQDSIGALIIAFVFFVSTLALSFVAIRMLVHFQGLAPFVGAFIAWTVGYVRLRYIEKNLDTHLFCRGTLLKKITMSRRLMYKLTEDTLQHIQSKIDLHKNKDL